MRKKRGYNRDTPVELVRDYKVFAIACEGSKREPGYFNLFQHISTKIKVDIIENSVSDDEMGLRQDSKSSPQWVLDRAMRYIDKEGLTEEDDLWFVIDKDRWTDEQIRTLAEHCNKFNNWHLVMSNPCFEVWLYFHKKENISDSESVNCEQFKNEISTLEKGGYHQYKFFPYFLDAIKNSKAADSDPKHFMPSLKETKVYLLGEALMKVIGKTAFDNFINNSLPNFIIKDVNKVKAPSKKKITPKKK